MSFHACVYVVWGQATNLFIGIRLLLCACVVCACVPAAVHPYVYLCVQVCVGVFI